MNPARLMKLKLYIKKKFNSDIIIVGREVSLDT